MFRAVLATGIVACGLIVGAADVQAQNLVPCASEGGFCRVPYPTRVIYGARGRSAERFARGEGVSCSNSVFGDPAPGVPKRCAFIARGYDRGRGGWNDDRREPSRWQERGPRDHGRHRDHDRWDGPSPAEYGDY
jgi:hypothetical protein